VLLTATSNTLQCCATAYWMLMQQQPISSAIYIMMISLPNDAPSSFLPELSTFLKVYTTFFFFFLEIGSFYKKSGVSL